MQIMDKSTNSSPNTATHSHRGISPGVSCLLLVHDEFEREGLRGLLANRGMNSVQSISHFELASEKLARFQPDIVIAVAGDPPDCPIDVLAPFRKAASGSGMIVACDPALVRTYLPIVSSMGDHRVTSARLLLRATLRDGDRMMVTVDQVLNGHQSVDADVIDVLVQGQFKRPNSLAMSLTKREFQVLELVGSGAANSNIARRLGMSPASVGNILTRVFAKLGLREDPDINRRVIASREFVMECGSGNGDQLSTDIAKKIADVA